MKTKLCIAICFLTIGLLKAQIITTVVGDSLSGYSGDGGQATAAKIYYPEHVALDAAGNIYIADTHNNVIRKVNTMGIISTVVGNATSGYSGDGGPATSAQLHSPGSVIIDASGNMYIADGYNSVIRKVNTSGIISTVAGNGTKAFSGDGGQAMTAALNFPSDMTFDASGNMYIADCGNNRIRKVNTSGIISTVVGNGTAAYSGDGGQATAAELNGPTGIALDVFSNIYIADTYNFVIRKINTSGIISTVAGNGTASNSGNGGQATGASLNTPFDIAIDATGNIFIADTYNNEVRKVNTAGIINTIAGNGTAGYSGDGGQAMTAELDFPNGIAIDAAGNLYTADTFNSAIRKVTNAATAGMKQFANNKEQLNIYPNPSNGSFQISYTGNMDEIKVSDMLGQPVYETKPNTTNTTLQINNAGVYLITLTSGTETTTKKVIVNK